MSFETVKEYIETKGLGERIKIFEQSSATVELAAIALNVEPARIAKTMSFLLGEQPILIVTSGDVKIDNKKYKTTFNFKARMMASELVKDSIGHLPGGVCPFLIKSDVLVYLDSSLKRFETVYPACGDNHSTVELSPEELEIMSYAKGWVDVCTEYISNK